MTTEIDSIQGNVEFSICTLVTNLEEYAKMRESFRNAGFTDTEFLYVDNSQGNKYDAYEAGNLFLSKASGEYVIICHQDILLKYDSINKLRECLDELEKLDNNWAIAGNAGYTNMAQKAIRITDPYGENQYIGSLPQQVRTLDENFILIKKSANLCLSHDLKGFHLYATDLCQIAYMLGWNAYVIDFHLYHKSGGNADQRFVDAVNAFRIKYTKALKPVFLRTPVTKIYISGSLLFNKLFNTKFCFRIVKNVQKLFG